VAGILASKGGLVPEACKNCGLSVMKLMGVRSTGCQEIDGTLYLFPYPFITAYFNGLNTLCNHRYGYCKL